MEFLRFCRNQWERSSAVALVVLALIVFLLGWLGLSDKSLVTEQIPYVVSGALFGLFLLALGTTMWLSADLHDEWLKLDRLEEVVSRAVAQSDAQSDGESDPAQSRRAPAPVPRADAGTNSSAGAASSRAARQAIAASGPKRRRGLRTSAEEVAQ